MFKQTNGVKDDGCILQEFWPLRITQKPSQTRIPYLHEYVYQWFIGWQEGDEDTGLT